MKLTRQAQIAIDILALCARPPEAEQVTTRLAAELCSTTKDHAAQIVARLVRTGYLASLRGRMGGIRLAVPASEINIGAVLRLMEPDFAAGPGQDPAAGESGHGFDRLQRAANEAFISTFDTYTVADLVEDPEKSRLGCLDCELNALARRARAFARADRQD